MDRWAQARREIMGWAAAERSSITGYSDTYSGMGHDKVQRTGTKISYRRDRANGFHQVSQL